MYSSRFFGVALLVLGVILFVAGMNASDSLSDRLSNFFTGKFTDATVWLLIGGVASVIGGLTLLMTGGRRGIV